VKTMLFQQCVGCVHVDEFPTQRYLLQPADAGWVGEAMAASVFRLQPAPYQPRDFAFNPSAPTSKAARGVGRVQRQPTTSTATKTATITANATLATTTTSTPIVRAERNAVPEPPLPERLVASGSCYPLPPPMESLRTSAPLFAGEPPALDTGQENAVGHADECWDLDTSLFTQDPGRAGDG
jgi:hypothetical protein